MSLAKNNVEGYKEAREVLRTAKKHYLENRYKKWLVCMVGVLIGCALGLGVPGIYNVLSNSLYDRKAIEGLMHELIG